MRKHILALIILTLGCVNADAKDIYRLAEFVRPAYTAMNFAALCARDNPSFLADTSGQLGSAFHYAEHVKNEAIVGLSQTDAVKILTLAADTARFSAIQNLHQFVQPGTDNINVGKIKNWCETDAKRFIEQLILDHDSDHDSWHAALERAKK